MKKLTQILMVTYSLMLLSSLNLNAQVDQTFWFVVPETTRDHKKAPGLLRITAFDKTATVRISQPANSNFQPITLTVPANRQEKVEFFDYNNKDRPERGDGSLAYEKMLWSIENGTLDAVTFNNGTVLKHDWDEFTMDAHNNPVVSGSNNIPIFNKGLLIESTNGADISVYYEVANGNNPERFNLKGSNALGSGFLIPSQNVFYNHYSKSREKVDIVATEDNTEITFTFDRNIHDFVGKPDTGNEFTITLNRGQTFSLRCNSPGTEAFRGKHLGGIFIESKDNKKIAITISDDSIQELDERGHWDLVGDQLIPITIAGYRHIAMHPSFGTIYGTSYKDYMSETASVSNRVFIWPVSEDPGRIYIDGIAVTKNSSEFFKRGDFYVANISDNGIFIETEERAIVYQISSYGYELGGGVLPALECTGSKQVSFARVYSGNFFIQILTKKKNIRDNNGQINLEVNTQSGNNLTEEFFGTSAQPIENRWEKVDTEEGLDENEEWYSFAKLIVDEFSTNDVVTVKFKDSEYNDEFDRLFHLSVLDANGRSMSYGYFSAYNALAVAGPNAMCIGTDVELTSNNPNASWFHDSNPLIPFETSSDTVYVTNTGEYWVEIPNSSCGSSEPVIIDYIIPNFQLGPDTIVCPGEPVDLGIEELAYTAEYSWYVNNVLVPDNQTFEYSFVTAANNTYNIILKAKTNVDGIECEHADTIVVTVGPQPVISLDEEEAVCAGSELRTDYYDFLTYEWVFPDGTISNDTYIIPADEGNYTLTVSTADGCTLTQDIDVTIHELPEVTLDPVMECIGTDGTLTPNITSTAASYTLLWNDENASTTPTLTLTEPREDIGVKVTDSNGCEAEDFASFGWHNETVFPSDTILMCYSNLLELEIEDSFTGYSWTYDPDPDSGGGPVALNGTTQTANNHILRIQAEANADSWSGRYFVEALDAHGCPVDSYFDLIITPLPYIELIQPQISVTDPSMCQGDTITITYTDNYDRQFTNYKWSYRADPLGTYTQIKDGPQDWIEAFDAGQYYLYAEMENGCNAEGDVQVTTVDAPVLEMSDQEACPEDNIVLEMASYNSNYNNESEPARYEWRRTIANMEITDQLPVISTDATYTVDEANRGSYRLTVFNSMGCFASEFAIASSLDETPVNLEDVEICENESYTLEIPAELASLGGTYQWHQESPVEMPFPFANQSWDLGEPAKGTYTYRLDYNNTDGCFSSGTMTLTVLPSPAFTLPSGEICEGETISITARG
jgi:hypothetical protein